MGSKGIRAGALLAAFACTVLLPITLLRGQELDQDPMEIAAFGYLVNHSSLDRVFRTRWKEHTNAILVGARPAALALQGRGGDLERTARPLVSPHQKLTSFKSVLGAPESSEAGMCGPSQIATDAVARLARDAARRHQVDPELAVAVAAAESHSYGLSNSSPMRLMPETAFRSSGTLPCNQPGSNRLGRIDKDNGYLRRLLDKFPNPVLAIAAYKAGEERIREFGGIPPSYDTVAFVAKVFNQKLGPPDPDLTSRERHSIALGTGVSERGVIKTRRSGEFVGGVMHFQRGASDD